MYLYPSLEFEKQYTNTSLECTSTGSFALKNLLSLTYTVMFYILMPELDLHVANEGGACPIMYIFSELL